MSERLITTLAQVTPEWLTTVLARSGALSRGSIRGVESKGGQGNWSSSGVLRLRYSEDAGGECPGSLFLKMVETDLGDGETFGPSEVDYYMRDYVGLSGAPLLRCFDASYSEAQQRYHLLLQDVSETHIEAFRKPLTLAYGLALAESLALLHAHHWGAEGLAQANAGRHNADHIRRFVEIAAPGAGHIIAHVSQELEPRWPGSIRLLFEHIAEVMIARNQDASGFTLIHGDVGDSNVLVPRRGQSPLYIIDRQPFNWSLTTWLGVYDLAYAIVLDWDPARRSSWERALLRRYHETLCSRGVQHYGWQQLWDDYRLCVAMCVLIAVEYCRGGINERWRHAWLPMLQRAMTACDELGCEQLWT